jgi:hypothetical protein
MEITQVILQSSSLKEITGFYGGLLELPVEQNKNNTGTNIGIGSTRLVFQQATAADPFYHFAINIPANKIDEAMQWLRQRVELIWLDDYNSYIADFTNWHAKSVYFYDPAGNIVELIARFDLHNTSPLDFSAAQFLSVSELGIVFKAGELDTGTENLLKQHRLNYFDKQAPLPQFKAIGDDQGLFIVVPENRNWYPTKKKAGIFPMTIEFDNKGSSYVLNLVAA